MGKATHPGRLAHGRSCSSRLSRLWQQLSGAAARSQAAKGSLSEASGARTAALRLLRRSELLLLAVVAFTSLTVLLSFLGGVPGSGLLHGSLSTHGSEHAQYVSQELLLRQLVEECARKQDSVIYLSPRGQMIVQDSLPTDAECPLLDVVFRGSERGVGMCTDVALYVIHAHARIIPLLDRAAMEAYEARCQKHTARMFLETIYDEWFSNKPGMAHIMQVNNEHMHAVDFYAHEKVDLFLCKTRFCQRLVKQYVRTHSLKADVWFMGHTSSDPSVGQPPRSKRQRRGWLSAWRHGGSSSSRRHLVVAAAAAVPGSGGPARPHDSMLPAALQLQDWPDYSQFLHVKGKSGLKHTKQLLECWAKHPEFPRLTVIGDNPFDEGPTQAVLDKPNVVLIPRPLPKEPPVPLRPQPGQQQEDSGDGWLGGAHDSSGVHVVHGRTDPQLTTFEDIRWMEASIGIHVCASEREGFGHYLNEARAVGALVLTTDHPPMNEFVANMTSGLLIAPDSTNSWTEWQALGNFTHINAFLSPDSVCKGVQQALALSMDERRRLGMAARIAFLEDRKSFLSKMRLFVHFLQLQPAERSSMYA